MLTALKGLEKLGKKKKITGFKKKEPPKPEFADKHDKPEDLESAPPKIVRIPRTIPSHLQNKVDKLEKGVALIDDERLGELAKTQERRAEVLNWMLNGHTHDNVLCDMHQLAEAFKVPHKTIRTDVSVLKTRMAKFYTEDDDTKEVAALAHMLLEMKFRDRGMALALYNQVRVDIAKADARDRKLRMRAKLEKNFKYDPGNALTGRDRAAMYGIMLSSIDLANRTTNGMESLLKLTGGAKKLQVIINAKNAQFNAGNGTLGDLTQVTIQAMVDKLMSGVLPSDRLHNKTAKLPAELELDDNDNAVLEVGEREDRKRKVRTLDAKP